MKIIYNKLLYALELDLIFHMFFLLMYIFIKLHYLNGFCLFQRLIIATIISPKYIKNFTCFSDTFGRHFFTSVFDAFGRPYFTSVRDSFGWHFFTSFRDAFGRPYFMNFRDAFGRPYFMSFRDAFSRPS